MLKHVHTVIINSLLVVLFLAIMLMPMTSLGLTSYKPIQDKNEVLSAQDERSLIEQETEELERWVEQETYYYDNVMKVLESTESTALEELE